MHSSNSRVELRPSALRIHNPPVRPLDYGRTGGFIVFGKNRHIEIKNYIKIFLGFGLSRDLFYWERMVGGVDFDK